MKNKGLINRPQFDIRAFAEGNALLIQKLEPNRGDHNYNFMARYHNYVMIVDIAEPLEIKGFVMYKHEMRYITIPIDAIINKEIIYYEMMVKQDEDQDK